MDTFDHPLKEKNRHKRHRDKNLVAKHLNEERDGLYKLKVIKPKIDYKRKKLNVRNLDDYIDQED